MQAQEPADNFQNGAGERAPRPWGCNLKACPGVFLRFGRKWAFTASLSIHEKKEYVRKYFFKIYGKIY
jgi:hypothetical protein